jgi:3-phenylpropionate/trans-cinnamate dioxygenase ferredoxin reductase component
MKKVKYLIIGGGMSADSAVRGIRTLDPNGSICLVSNENVGPYNRPPLSKGLWKGKSIDKIWRKTEKQNIDLNLSTQAIRLDPGNKSLLLNSSEEITYEKALLATGATPRKFPFAENSVNYFRFLSDYENLRSLTNSKQEFVIIGGGFIGSELAASLAGLGKNVTIIFPEKWLCQRIFPPEIGSYLRDVFQENGIRIISEISIEGIDTVSSKSIVHIKNWQGEISDLSADGLIAGLGVIPNISLAQDSGLSTENGIKVDPHFRTDHADIFASGDVANYFDPILKKNRRVEHEDHANATGMLAGRNMAGSDESYVYLPYFYSDLFDIGYEAVGDLDASLEVTIDWQEPYKKGVFYYQRDSHVVGILLWNFWGQLEKARTIIADAQELTKNELPGLIA